MNCPTCGGETKVRSTRTTRSQAPCTGFTKDDVRALDEMTGSWVARQRRCFDCKGDFETVELPVGLTALVGFEAPVRPEPRPAPAVDPSGALWCVPSCPERLRGQCRVTGEAVALDGVCRVVVGETR